MSKKLNGKKFHPSSKASHEKASVRDNEHSSTGMPHVVGERGDPQVSPYLNKIIILATCIHFITMYILLSSSLNGYIFIYSWVVIFNSILLIVNYISGKENSLIYHIIGPYFGLPSLEFFKEPIRLLINQYNEQQTNKK